MISKIFSLRNYVMKQLMKTNKSGIMKIPDKGKIDFGEMIIKEQLYTGGVDHRLIKSEKELENALNSIASQKKQKLKQDYDEHVGTNIDGSKNYFYTHKEKPKKPSGEVIDVDFGNWPEKKAGGGRTGSGLNYLLGEDDQNSRVPYASGSRKKSWTDKIAGWTGGTNVMAGEIGLETWDLLNNLLQSGGLYAEGGRTGFGLGGMGRRAFLKLMGGTAAGVGAAKSGLFGLLKGGGKKQVVETLTSVPIKDIKGMPAWFKPLVNKVIKEGNDVTKNWAYKERQMVHKSQLPDSKTDVYVTQDLDSGDVWVDIGVEKHGFADGKFGQPVRLEYKAAEDIMSGPSDEPFKVGERDPLLRIKSSVHEDLVGSGLKGDPKTLNLKPGKTKEEFWVEEAEFSGGHPENVKFEDVSIEKFGEHGSDFSEVEEFATGLKKGKGGSGHMASGGRVPLAGGGGIMKLIKKLLAKTQNKKLPWWKRMGFDNQLLPMGVEKVAKHVVKNPIDAAAAGATGTLIARSLHKDKKASGGLAGMLGE